MANMQSGIVEVSLRSTNANTLRDCFSTELLKRMASASVKANGRTKSEIKARGKGRGKVKGKAGSKGTGRMGTGTKETSGREKDDGDDVDVENQGGGNDEEDLADFIDYLSQELFDALPAEIQDLSYSAIQSNAALAERLSSTSYAAEVLLPLLPPNIAESLTTYALLPAERTSVANVLVATLDSYVASATAAPPVWSTTRADVEGCEICGRDWLPLTYHHLIPKSTHERVLKRGWHEEWMLNSVAWLCRACHSYVHSIESNETLAREYFTVDRLLEREDVRRWASWAKRVRWKAK